MFKGVCTALITPFDKNGVDYDAFSKLIEFQISNSVDALLVCGTTGEPATMTATEKEAVIKFVIKQVNKRVPVLVGTGTNCTKTAIENSINAEKWGADAILLVTPYYNKCTQEGLYQHYKAICESVSLPAICYNVPGRTGVNILPKTALRLSTIPNMVGIKEACGNVTQISETARLIAGTHLDLYSGDDGLSLPIMALGGVGIISVASHIIPQQMHDLAMSYLNGDVAKSREIQFKYAELMDDLFLETNPIPVKQACNYLNLCQNELRLPLTQMSKANAEILYNAMKNVNLVK
ncbi:MAG: 4-hydroxy-tetrahydrodipicolinate synthase [Clostridia bacterium]